MVSQDAIHLVTGISALHEVGATGGGVRIGMLDAAVLDPVNQAYAVESLEVRPRRRARPGFRSHGDQMIDLLRSAAPDARAVLAEVSEGDGLVFRPSIVEGLAALEDRSVAVTLISIEIRRHPDRCSASTPCVACSATRSAAARGIVVVAAGNTGEEGFTCPAAEAEGAIVVLATVGPADVDAAPGGGASGTSVSAALTAGGIAALASALPGLTTSEAESSLRATATPLRDRRLVRSHFFRAFRYASHLRSGGAADESTAQSIIDENAALLSASTRDATDVDAVAVLDRALTYAPWSAELHGHRARLLADEDPGEALGAIAEAIRLDWETAWLHRQLADQLDDVGLPGGQVERTIATHLEAGDVGRAARALADGLAGPAPAQHVRRARAR